MNLFRRSGGLASEKETIVRREDKIIEALLRASGKQDKPATSSAMRIMERRPAVVACHIDDFAIVHGGSFERPIR